MSRRFRIQDDAGAILPIFALLIVVLLVFAAFTVDLGAAWAQRRQSQTAADSGVMAAALEYLRDTSSNETGIYNLVNDYVNANLTGTDLAFDDWETCVDGGRPIDYAPLGTTGNLDGNDDGTPGDITDCISIKQVDESPAVLRVRVPNKDVPTSFARLIGVDSIAVSAFAEAEIRYLESSKIIPFALPADAETEECLNTPPNGQLPDVTPDCGSDSGNFGFLDLHWYGSPDPHDNVARSCGNNPYPNFEARTPQNLALGVDHPLSPWPDESGNGITTTPVPGSDPPIYIGYDGPGINTVVPQNADDIVDSCVNAATGIPPVAVGTRTGNQALLDDGLFGVEQFGLPNAPGRLRQTNPDPFPNGPIPADPAPDRITISDNAEDFTVDNVGLWNYLDFSSSGDECRESDFSTKEGRELTDQMSKCLREGDPFFRSEIVDSPRFSVVPVLNYTGQSGDQNWAIITLRPVYIHTVWFECKDNQSNDPFCMFEPDGFDTYVPPDLPVYVTLISPQDLADVSGTAVTVSANSHTTGSATVTQVEFFVDGSSIGIDTSNPYDSVVWDSTTSKDGAVTISAVATDSEGNTAIDTHTVMVENNKTFPPLTPSAALGKSIYFNPGEGEIQPCVPNKADDDCIHPNEITAEGMSAFALLPEWLPDSVKNALGSSSPYEVYLRK